MSISSIRSSVRNSVPNMLTICNSLCGFAAILNTLRVYEKVTDGEKLNVIAASATMIFCAMIFDAMDGFAARKLHAQSDTGIQMDSLSDMVTFGVAPATLVTIMNHCLQGDYMLRLPQIAVYLLCSVYLGCAALRLAIYNVEAAKPHKISTGRFSGMPSPGAAAAICVIILFARKTPIDIRLLAFALPIYAGILGLLMVSRISYLHAGKWLISMFHSPRKLLAFAILLTIAIIFREHGLALIVTGYVLSGPVESLCKKVRQRTNA